MNRMCGAAGCNAPAASGGPAHYEQALALLLPQRIQIQPFTRIASFNDDEVPDGISVALGVTLKTGLDFRRGPHIARQNFKR